MRYFILFASMVFFLTMCKDKKDDPPQQPSGPTDKRDLFVGTYKVISETPNYYFTCSKFDTLNNQTWVRLHNICNLFDMEFKVLENVGQVNLLPLPKYFPIRDKFNNRWDFDMYANDTIRNVNLIVNDTFRLYYRLQNTPWHIDDDTTYMNKMFLMVAVRGQ